MDFPELAKTPLQEALSLYGKRVFLPQGIFYWAGLAKTAEINGTIGTAKGSELNSFYGISNDDKIAFFVKNMDDYLASDVSASLIAPYAPIGGLPPLREKWKKWILEKTGLKNKDDIESLISLPIVTCGITNSIFHAVRFFVGEGESVLVSDKYWGNYNTIIKLNIGAGIDVFKTFDGQVFNTASMSEQIKAQVKKQKKAVLMLNFPNNPSGYCPPEDEMQQIANALIKTTSEVKKPVIVLIDDAYEGYVYDPAGEKRSLFAFLVDKDPNLIPVKLDGASKELLFYGGRVAFITIGFSSKWDVDLATLNKELDNKLSGGIRGTNSNAARISQTLVIKLLDSMEKTLENRKKVFDILAERWTEFQKNASQLHAPDKGIYFDPYQGGFFAFLNLPKDISAEKVAKKLLDDQSVGVIPIEKPDIGVNGLRVAYCSMPKEIIGETLSRISKSLE